MARLRITYEDTPFALTILGEPCEDTWDMLADSTVSYADALAFAKEHDGAAGWFELMHPEGEDINARDLLHWLGY